MNEAYTVGTIITLLTAAIGVFMKGTIMLTANHEKDMARMEERLEEERRRTERAEQRADQLLAYGMKVAGVSEELIIAAKQRDHRDLRRDVRDDQGRR